MKQQPIENWEKEWSKARDVVVEMVSGDSEKTLRIMEVFGVVMKKAKEGAKREAIEEIIIKMPLEQKRRGKFGEKWAEGWNACLLVIKELSSLTKKGNA